VPVEVPEFAESLWASPPEHLRAVRQRGMDAVMNGKPGTAAARRAS
jgi:hypothetical protein